MPAFDIGQNCGNVTVFAVESEAPLMKVLGNIGKPSLDRRRRQGPGADVWRRIKAVVEAS